MDKRLNAETVTEALGARSSIVVHGDKGLEIVAVNLLTDCRAEHLKTILGFEGITDSTQVILRTPYYGETSDDFDVIWELREEYDDQPEHQVDLEYAINLHGLRGEVGLDLGNVSNPEMSINSRVQNDEEVFSSIMERIWAGVTYKY